MSDAMLRVICKNDKCFNVVPPSKGSGRPREYCTERCRKRYNAALHYQRATKGSAFLGLRTVNDLGYPQVKRIKCKTAADAEKRVKEHGENCAGPGVYCQAKMYDAYNTKKLCLVRAVFSDDWVELMYAADGIVRERDMTTEDGMWKDDFKEMLEKQGIDPNNSMNTLAAEVAAFQAAGGQKQGSLSS